MTRKPFKGDPLNVKAHDYGDLLKMLELWRSGNLTGGASLSSDKKELSGWNRSGQALAAGSVVEFDLAAWDGVSFDKSKFQQSWSFDLATETGINEGRIGIVKRPMRDDGAGEISIIGQSYALLDVVDAGHLFANPVAGEVRLETSDAGTFRVLKKLGAGTAGTGFVMPSVSALSAKTNGFFNCCRCENPELHVSIEGDGITWEHVRNDLWPVKSSGGLLHKIILTSDDDPAVTREIELPQVDCADIDCQTQEMTGEFVGTREIESIIFGNSDTCTTFCDPVPAITYLEETFAALPTAPWSTSLANSSVTSNVMTMTAQDSMGADFGPSVASQVFHTKIRFRVIPNVSLSTAIWIAIEGRLFSFADDGTWSSDGFTGIGTAGATIEFLIVDNVVTVDGAAAGTIAPGSVSGCGAEVSFVLRTTDISAFNPPVGTDVGEFDVLEIGYR